MTLINIAVAGSHFNASDLAPLDESAESRPLRMLDPGFSRTASCCSAITFLDGDAGELRYRGYDVAELAERVSFEAVCHLLITGELPDDRELAALRGRSEIGLPPELRELATQLGSKCHPMLAMQAVTAALGGYLPPRTAGDADAYRRSLDVFLSWWPQLAGDIHRAHLGLDPIHAPIGSYAERLLRASGLATDSATVRAMEVLLVCHADHEQNCSTTTARTAASAHADVFAAVSAALGSLSGPLHGGANEAVIRQLSELALTNSDGPALIADVESGALRLMGFGHRVYKNYDPRARIIRDTADAVFQTRGEHPLLQLALDVERAALSSEYFKARKLYPNVDFFSGLVYDVIGFERSFFTVLFALGRIPGWLAHAAEQLEDPAQRIVRPLQVFNGVPPRSLA